MLIRPLRGKIRGLRIQSHHQHHQHQHPMTQKVKLENCQWAFGEEKTLEWLSKIGKPLTPLEEETYNFGSDDEDGLPRCIWNWKFVCKDDN